MIRAALCDASEVRHLLAHCMSDKTDRAGQFDIDQIIADGQTYQITDDNGQIVAAYVLQAYGSLLWITAAAGRAPFDLSDAITKLVEVQGRRFDAVGFRTERKGLVRKTQKLGYQIHEYDAPAYYMRKKLHA